MTFVFYSYAWRAHFSPFGKNPFGKPFGNLSGLRHVPHVSFRDFPLPRLSGTQTRFCLHSIKKRTSNVDIGRGDPKMRTPKPQKYT